MGHHWNLKFKPVYGSVFSVARELRRAASLIVIAGAVVFQGIPDVRGQFSNPTTTAVVTIEQDPGGLSPATTPPEQKTEKQEEDAKPKKEKRGSLVIAPIPISSP